MVFIKRLLLAVATSSLFAVACGEIPESSYSDLRSARLQGAFAGGWLPAYLPSSATSLHERHDLASNAALLAFSFDPSEAFIASAPCVAVAEADVPPPPRLGRTKWWPKDLLATRRGGFRLFHCEDSRFPKPGGQAWLALDNARGEAFIWRASR